MADPIEAIHVQSIALAKSKLSFIRFGAKFTGDETPFPNDPDKLEKAIIELEEKLQRHKERMEQASKP